MSHFVAVIMGTVKEAHISMSAASPSRFHLRTWNGTVVMTVKLQESHSIVSVLRSRRRGRLSAPTKKNAGGQDFTICHALRSLTTQLHKVN